MALGIIDINDSGVTATVGGNPAIDSPAYAVLEGETLRVGLDGLRNYRLLPRWTNNRFWHQLGLDPLPNATPAIRHHADLAFAHMEHIWEDIKADVDEVVLVVPAHYDRDQLGLLLGMARECQLPVVGIVDAAVAAVAEAEPYEHLLYLDIQLHRISVSVIRRGLQLVNDGTSTIADTGLHELRDAWAKTVATQFIRTDRFDPMQLAESEQALYNQLPAWLASLAEKPDAPFELELTEATYSTTVDTDQLLTACASLYPRLLEQIRTRTDDKPAVLLCLSHRFKGFPALRQSLALIPNCRLHQLPDNATTRGVLKHLDYIRSDANALTFVTSLPSETSPLSLVGEAGGEAPTHLLHAGRAFPIDQSVALGSDPSGNLVRDPNEPQCTVLVEARQAFVVNHGSRGTSVNGDPVHDRVRLAPGDTVVVGNTELMAIAVLV